jgi:murein DD-endopeptidase MepM/ murein hydrolase activator NlpD
MTVLTALPARASTQSDLAAARQQLADARAAANAAAGDFAQAESAEAALDGRIADLESSIAADKAKADGLRAIARQRAVYAYTHQNQQLETFASASDAITAIRDEQLLSHANETDRSAIRRLSALEADLRDKQAELQKERQAADAVRVKLAARNSELQGKLAAVQQAVAGLQKQYDAEQAKAASDFQAALAAQRNADLGSGSGGSTGSGAGAVVTGSFNCPVIGAAYTDDFGGVRQHPGIDMFVPIGTPLYAVKSGSVFYMANDGAGGNEAYVNADDGNTYYYAHLSSFSGGARAVHQGEVIGFSGMTGNASGPHLHFEIRIGGPNGSRIDPYPTLRAAGC